jgi:hypothetical protein
MKLNQEVIVVFIIAVSLAMAGIFIFHVFSSIHETKR